MACASSGCSRLYRRSLPIPCHSALPIRPTYKGLSKRPTSKQSTSLTHESPSPNRQTATSLQPTPLQLPRMAPHSSTTAVAAAQTPHRATSASTSTQNPQQQAPISMSSSSSTAQSTGGAAALGAAGTTTTTTTTPLARSRQYTHLHAQLAQLNAHLADTENLLHMTAVQADYLRGLGAWWGGA